MLRARKLCDKLAVVLVRARTRVRPWQRRDFGPGCLRRPPLMANAIRGVDQAGTVVTGHAVEEDRLPGGIRKQVSRGGHLCQSCARPTHRNQEPRHSGFVHYFGLFHVLRVVAVDRGQRHDGPDSLARDDRPQRVRMLPRPSYQSAGIDDVRSFFGPLIPTSGNTPASADNRRQRYAHSEFASGHPCHSLAFDNFNTVGVGLIPTGDDNSSPGLEPINPNKMWCPRLLRQARAEDRRESTVPTACFASDWRNAPHVPETGVLTA